MAIKDYTGQQTTIPVTNLTQQPLSLSASYVRGVSKVSIVLPPGNTVLIDRNLIFADRDVFQGLRTAGLIAYDEAIVQSDEEPAGGQGATGVAGATGAGSPGPTGMQGVTGPSGGGSALQEVTVTLTPAEIETLHTYPGKTLVAGQPPKAIVCHSLEFYLSFNTTVYSASGNLQLNYLGNFPGGLQVPTAMFTTTNNNLRRQFVFNSATQIALPTGDLILMATSPITGGDSDLKVRVRYEALTTLT